MIDTGTRPSEYAHDLLDMARGLNLRGAAAPRGSVRPRIALPSALFGFAVLLSAGRAMPTAAGAQQPAASAQQ